RDWSSDVCSSDLSRSLARSIKSRITSCLKKAVDVGLLEKNPAIGTELSKLKTRQIKALTREEQNKLVARCRQEEYANIFIFLLVTGMRLGEVTGLTWDRVDMKDRTITISQIMVEVHGNPVLQNYPKTDSSVRILPISNEAYAILEERKKLNDVE